MYILPGPLTQRHAPPPAMPDATLRLRAPLLVSSLVAVALLVAGCDRSSTGSNQGAAPAAPPPLPVTVLEMQPRSVPIVLEAVARTEGSREVEVRARVTGILERQLFREGEPIRAGDPLMDGPRNPHDILSVLGEKELQAYLVNEIQEVYRLQGVKINDKHIEIIVRQMLRRVRVTDVGDTEFLIDEQVEKWVQSESSVREAERKLEDVGVPCIRCRSVKELADSDPHIRAREMMVTVEQPFIGPMRHYGSPLKMSETPCGVRDYSPFLGEHNPEVLSEMLGYDLHDPRMVQFRE